MIYFLLIICIIFILSWLFIKTLRDVSNEKNQEDHNYEALKKLFFAVNGNNINTSYLTESNSIYGVLLEAHSNENKILFASYITGFAGYYQSKGGGLIGGKFYQENDENVQHELMKLCDYKELNGENQSKETRKMAIKLTMKANSFLSKTIKESSWNNNSNTFKFWFLTKGGVYYAEEQKSLIFNSLWKELLDDAFCIIKALNRV